MEKGHLGANKTKDQSDSHPVENQPIKQNLQNPTWNVIVIALPFKILVHKHYKTSKLGQKRQVCYC